MDRITSLFGIKYPIIQGGMVWCVWLAVGVGSGNAGGLGLLGAGSMHPDTLREHIQKVSCGYASFIWGEDIPLMYPQIEEVMQIVAEEGVRIVFTSAGNPKSWTGWLKEHGITVVHVVSSSRFAMKARLPVWMPLWPKVLKPADTTGVKNNYALFDSLRTCGHYTAFDCGRWHYFR